MTDQLQATFADPGKFSVADYVVFALALLLSAAIGVYYGCTGGKQKTVSEFLMADRQMKLLPAAMSILASFMSAISMLGTPAEIYKYGTMYLWIVISYVFTILISAYIYIPVFFRLGVTSAYEYLERRFSRGLRTYGAVVYIVQMVLYMAMVLYAPALALSTVTGLNSLVAVISTGAVCTFYTALGGMKAVMWTDTLQIFIMYAGLLAVIIEGSIKQGGADMVWNDSLKSGRIDFYNTTLAFNPNPLERHTFWTLAIGGIFTWTAIYGVNQAQVQRALTVPTLKKAQTAYLINIAGLATFACLGSACGLIIYSRYKDCDPLTREQQKLGSSDELFPYFVMDILGSLEGLPGLFTAAIFSGALSTVSSGLNSVAAVSLEDLVKTYIKPDITDERSTQLSKVLAIAFGGASIALTFAAEQLGGVLQAALSLFGMLGGPILGLYSLGMFFPCANTIGGYAGVTCGLMLTLWIGIGQQIYPPNLYKYPVSTEGCFNRTSAGDIAGNMTTAASWYYSTNSYNISESATKAFNYTTVNDGGSETSASGLEAMYSLSYMWFSAVGCLSTVIIGLIVSCATGPTREMDRRLVSPIAVAVHERLPFGMRRGCCNLYTSSDENGVEDPQSTIKLPNGKARIEHSVSQVELLTRVDSTTSM